MSLFPSAPLKLSRYPHSLADALAPEPSISEVSFFEFRFDFVADLFRVRCFCDLGEVGLPTADAACCSSGMDDTGFFRRASRCLSFSRR